MCVHISIDRLLARGGLPFHEVCEVLGPSAAGKTQVIRDVMVGFVYDVYSITYFWMCVSSMQIE